MELKEAIEKRRTVRDFQDKLVPANVMKYALENAFKAPTYNHLREWDFIIVNSMETKLQLTEDEQMDQPADIQAIDELVRNEDVVMREMYLEAIPKQKKMILEAPYVVIVVFKPKTKVADAKRVYDLNCLASVWACIQNFLLSLAEHDVYGVTFIPKNTGSVRKKLGIPDELEVASIIPVGYKADRPKVLSQKKIEVKERIHYEKW